MQEASTVTPLGMSQALVARFYLCSHEFGVAHLSMLEPKVPRETPKEKRCMYMRVDLSDTPAVRTFAEKYIFDCIRNDMPITHEGLMAYLNDQFTPAEWYLMLTLKVTGECCHSVENGERSISDFVGIVRALAAKQKKTVKVKPSRRKARA